ncbi:MAG TPA: P1 family peptidase, partial [Roseateles sp.]|nr:P1 family peptidase [Roseateles sp.]
KLRGIAHAMKGGIGTASLTVDGITVGALVVVNAIGDIVDPANGRLLAGARGDDGRPLGMVAAMLRGELPSVPLTGTATTLGIVATNARLTKAGATKLAQMSHDGLARCINPVHTVSDGDVMFALATGGPAEAAGDLRLLGPLAAEVTSRAVLRALRAATGLPGLPAIGELPG